MFPMFIALLFDRAMCKHIDFCFELTYDMVFLLYRVGSHVVSVRIHCTEKWRTSFHNVDWFSPFNSLSAY